MEYNVIPKVEGRRSDIESREDIALITLVVHDDVGEAIVMRFGFLSITPHSRNILLA
jgi:hypothetical protein